MATTFKTLYQGQPGTGATLLYTAPAGWQAVIKQIRAVNATQNQPSTIALYKNGSTAANMIQPAVPLAPGEFAEDDGTMTLAPGDTLYAIAGNAATITVTISGVEYQ